MNIVVTGRNVEVTDALRTYAEEKISKFEEKYQLKITSASIALSVQKHRHIAEVVVKAKGETVKAESSTEELYSSIDEVVDKLDKQLKKAKDKRAKRRKGAESPGRMDAAEAVSPTEEAPAEGVTIVERRQQAVKPMPPEEAAMQLEISDLNFFVFTNSDSGSINVIYRMADGNLGLIEPA